MIDATYLINLERRPDRLKSACDMLKKVGWTDFFPEPIIFNAIDGSKVPYPHGFKSGGGAWGCLQSHRMILQEAFINNYKCICVLEDDISMKIDFIPKVKEFFSKVPSDWQGIFLGGQHIATPIRMPDGIVKARNIQRTHGYIMRGEFLAEMYKTWFSSTCTVHCDHVMGPITANFPVYAPDPFLIAQAQGQSDISGAFNPHKNWSGGDLSKPVYVVHCNETLRNTLNSMPMGYHFGSLDELNYIFDPLQNEQNRLMKLGRFINQRQDDVGAMPEQKYVSIWHNSATKEFVEKICKSKVIEIRATTVEEALSFLPAVDERSLIPDTIVPLNYTDTYIIHYTGDKRNLPSLRAAGFHFGYSRDAASDRDTGLNRIVEQNLGVDSLIGWIKELQREARNITAGVVAVYHPKINESYLQAAADTCSLKIVKINGSTAEDCIRIWKETTGEKSNEKIHS